MIRELRDIRAYIAKMNETMGNEQTYDMSKLRYRADAALDVIESELFPVIANAQANAYARAKEILDKEQKQ